MFERENYQRKQLETLLKEKELQINELKLYSEQLEQQVAKLSSKVLNEDELKELIEIKHYLKDNLNLSDVKTLTQRLQFTENENLTIKSQFEESQKLVQKLNK